MSPDVVADLVKGAVALLLALVGGGVGWDQIRRHGAETERRKQAERERDEANIRAEHAAQAPASPREVVGILQRLRRRRERLRKESDHR